jgi:hypothetical protein
MCIVLRMTIGDETQRNLMRTHVVFGVPGGMEKESVQQKHKVVNFYSHV